MTVKASKDFGSEKTGENKKKAVNNSSSKEEESSSPKKKVHHHHHHNQVLRIREEESHIGEDIGELFSSGGGVGVVDDDVNVLKVILTRPILPCSPLSGKTVTTTTTNVKALHS